MNAPDPADLAAAVAAMLPGAAEIGLASFRTPLATDDKGGEEWYDPVTEADRAIERHLREQITAAFPDHRVVGEEYGTTGPAEAVVTWVLDPIDGTRAYISGVPTWGTLIGVVADGRAVAGWLHQPYIEETFYALDGQAWLDRRGDRRRLQVRGTTDLGAATLYSTTPEMFYTPELAADYDRLVRRVRLHRYGADCYSYAMLAAGMVDLVVENLLAPYDITALVPIIEAAGGTVTDREGGSPLDGGFIVAAATDELHRQALAVLNDQE